MNTVKRFFKVIWFGWKRFAHRLGVIQTKLILAILYFVIIGIAALITKILRIDLLDRRIRKSVSYWRTREPFVPDIEGCKRQF